MLQEMTVIDVAINVTATSLNYAVSKVSGIWNEAVDFISPTVNEVVNKEWQRSIFIVISTLLVCSLLICFFMLCRQSDSHDSNGSLAIPTIDLIDVAKTAFKRGYCESLIQHLRVVNYDFNYPVTSSGLTLFLSACISGNLTLVAYMLNTGRVDINLTTKTGDSCLYLSVYSVILSPHPDTKLVELLIKYGCDVNAQNSDGFTALHRAASQGYRALIKCLIRNGADVTIATRTGITPLDLALSKGYYELANLLQTEKKNYMFANIEE